MLVVLAEVEEVVEEEVSELMVAVLVVVVLVVEVAMELVLEAVEEVLAVPVDVEDVVDVEVAEDTHENVVVLKMTGP